MLQVVYIQTHLLSIYFIIIFSATCGPLVASSGTKTAKTTACTVAGWTDAGSIYRKAWFSFLCCVAFMCVLLLYSNNPDVALLQACYGILKVPQGNWLCRTCALGVQPKCLLCPKRGGALKPTRSGTKWVHVSCALWIPEVGVTQRS